ncbi:hypothetical protein QIO_0436 [Clostridioides difficile DA00129]|nr:hypothetical protein QIO_0436 [Clostridioides difficile DA00129]
MCEDSLIIIFQGIKTEEFQIFRETTLSVIGLRSYYYAKGAFDE